VLDGFLVPVGPDGGIVTVCAFVGMRLERARNEEEEEEISSDPVHKILLCKYATSGKEMRSRNKRTHS
jgi:hypothetical protein